MDASRSYAARYIGSPENRNLKAQIAEILAANQHRSVVFPFPKLRVAITGSLLSRAIVSDEPDKLYTCSIHIKNEAKASMSDEEKLAVYHSVRDDVWAKLGKDDLVTPLAHNCMEVTSSALHRPSSSEADG